MNIVIRQHSFSISAPYSEGTVLTAGEAQALNGLRAENIRNGVAKLVLEAQTRAGHDLVKGVQFLSELEHAQVQAKITEFERRYKFKLRAEARQRVGVVEAEARVVARERVETQARLGGFSLDEAGIEAWVQVELARAEVQDEARRRIEARRNIADRGIEEMLG